MKKTFLLFFNAWLYRKNNKLESLARPRENQVVLQSICSNKNSVESKDNVYTEAKKHIKIEDKHALEAECTTSDCQEDHVNKEILLSYGKDINRSKLLREPCDSKQQSVVARNHVDDVAVNKVLNSEFISVRLISVVIIQSYGFNYYSTIV